MADLPHGDALNSANPAITSADATPLLQRRQASGQPQGGSMPQEGKTHGVVFVADYFATWSAGLLVETGREKLTAWALTSEQEPALRQAATAALNHDITQLQGQRIERVLPNGRIRCRR